MQLSLMPPSRFSWNFEVESGVMWANRWKNKIKGQPYGSPVMAGEMCGLMFVPHGYVILPDRKTNSKGKIFQISSRSKKLAFPGQNGEITSSHHFWGLRPEQWNFLKISPSKRLLPAIFSSFGHNWRTSEPIWKHIGLKSMRGQSLPPWIFPK